MDTDKCTTIRMYEWGYTGDCYVNCKRCGSYRRCNRLQKDDVGVAKLISEPCLKAVAFFKVPFAKVNADRWYKKWYKEVIKDPSIRTNVQAERHFKAFCKTHGKVW